MVFLSEEIMIKNYLKVAIRNLLKHKGYAFINILGLAVGIAASVLIFLYITNEMSYDKFHEKADRTYRIKADWSNKGDSRIHQLGTPFILARPSGKNTRRSRPSPRSQALWAM